jgi:hypothetical protein
MSVEMRQRFRVSNEFFAAETRATGRGFEVKVYSLRTADGYFKQDILKPVLHLRGEDEEELLRQARAWIESLKSGNKK